MRAQFSFDLMVTLAFGLLVLGVLVASFDAPFKASREHQNRLDANRIADALAGAGNAVLAAGNASNYSIPLPAALSSGDAFTVSVMPGVGEGARVDVAWAGGSASRPLATRSATGTVSAGATAAVRNDNGRLVFS